MQLHDSHKLEKSRNVIKYDKIDGVGIFRTCSREAQLKRNKSSMYPPTCEIFKPKLKHTPGSVSKIENDQLELFSFNYF